MEGTGDLFLLLSDEMVLAIMDHLEDETLATCRLVCRRWNLLVEDPQLVRNKLGFCKDVKEEIATTLSCIHDSFQQMDAKVARTGHPQAKAANVNMWRIFTAMNEFHVVSKLIALISCYEENISWRDQVKSRQQREAAMDTLAESAAKLHKFLKMEQFIKVLEGNPWKIDMPFRDLFPPLNRLMAFLSVSDATMIAASITVGTLVSPGSLKKS